MIRLVAFAALLVAFVYLQFWYLNVVKPQPWVLKNWCGGNVRDVLGPALYEYRNEHKKFPGKLASWGNWSRSGLRPYQFVRQRLVTFWAITLSLGGDEILIRAATRLVMTVSRLRYVAVVITTLRL